MPRAGLSVDAVVGMALELADEAGPDFTLAALADRAGVATPSLYKHVGGLPELRALLAARALDELSDRVEAALAERSGRDRIRAFLAAYRRYAVDHPARYALIPAQPGGHPEPLRAAQRLLDLTAAAIGRDRLEDPDTIHRARALRSAAHGFATLESAGGFGMPADLDVSFGLLSDALIRGLDLDTAREWA